MSVPHPLGLGYSFIDRDSGLGGELARRGVRQGLSLERRKTTLPDSRGRSPERGLEGRECALGKATEDGGMTSTNAQQGQSLAFYWGYDRMKNDGIDHLEIRRDVD